MNTHTIKHFIFILLVILLWIPILLFADNFTPKENQEINTATQGLFAKTKSFSVDFTNIKETEYSFPLPVGKATATTRGLEILTLKGDAVKAMFPGTVRLSRNLPSHGNVIVIRHNNGLETVYGGNSQNLVKVGDRVKAGQTIAIVGTQAENAEKGRLLFEIMVNGCNINPQTLIQINGHKLYKHIYKFTNRDKSVEIEIEDNEEDAIDNADSPVDMEREFTSQEQCIVSAKTPGLFDNSNTITINFAEYEDNDWCYPLIGSHVISDYGGKRRHSGVDLKTKPNDDIHAAFTGRVRFAKSYAGYGNVIVIRHASGLETLYSHNSKNLVKVGDWVKAGQVIALTGRTGRATTEHCHFEIRINGKAYNPALIFNHAQRKLKRVKLIANKNGKISVSSVK